MIHMNEKQLSTINDCGVIHSDGNSVLMHSKNLWLFRTDGSFVAKYKEVRNPSKVAFLPGNKVLVDGLADGSYHYIDLCSGELLWSSIKKGRRLRFMPHFAVAPDAKTLYDLYYDLKGICYIDRIVPEEHLHTKHTIAEKLVTTDDFYCSEDGTLCTLQGEIIEDYCQPRGVLRLPWIDGEPVPEWGDRWISPAYPGVNCGNEQFILYMNLYVSNRKTNEVFDLLENDTFPRPPHDAFAYNYDPKTGYLNISYLICDLCIIIDCKARKRIAQYFREDCFGGVGFRGCVINDEFWVGTKKGIIKRPFPYIDQQER